MRLFLLGLRGMLPITTGIIPFGAVMGSVSAATKLTFFQSVWMNLILFAGSSQLAALDLMSKQTPIWIVVATGLMINIRFLLYSAAFSPVVQRSSLLVKVAGSFLLTDQTFAVMSANQEKFKNNSEALKFYFGAAICMFLAWHFSVAAGFVLGNFVPPSLSLDFAVPLSFVSLVVPSLKNKKYLLVAACSGILSIFLKPMPYNLGLLISILVSMLIAIQVSKTKIKTSPMKKVKP